MTPRTTGILALVALALGAFIYFVEVGGEASRKAAAQADLRLFPDLDAEAIEAVEFVSLDGVPVRFERSGEGAGWILPAFGDAPADVAAIEGLIESVANLTREGEVDDAQSLAPFGLGEGAQTLSFEVAGEIQTLRVGGTAPVGGFVYVTTALSDAVPSVSFVESFKLNGFRRNMLDLRDRTIGESFGELDAFDLRWPGTELAFRKNDSGAWRVDVPAAELVDQPADQETVQALLDDISYLKANGFVDVPDASANAAIEAPALSIAWNVSGESHRIAFGDLYGEGRIARTVTGRLVTIPTERFEDFERSVSAYRDRTLSLFEATDALGMTLRFVDAEGTAQEVSLLREAEGWKAEGSSPDERIDGQIDGQIDGLAVGGLIATLSNLRASEMVADAMGEAELSAFGLAPPQAEIVVRGSNEALLAMVHLGRLDPTRGQFARTAGASPERATVRGAIFAVDASTAEELPSAWAQFLEAFSVSAPAASDDEL